MSCGNIWSCSGLSPCHEWRDGQCLRKKFEGLFLLFHLSFTTSIKFIYNSLGESPSVSIRREWYGGNELQKLLCKCLNLSGIFYFFYFCRQSFWYFLFFASNLSGWYFRFNVKFHFYFCQWIFKKNYWILCMSQNFCWWVEDKIASFAKTNISKKEEKIF